MFGILGPLDSASSQPQLRRLLPPGYSSTWEALSHGLGWHTFVFD